MSDLDGRCDKLLMGLRCDQPWGHPDDVPCHVEAEMPADVGWLVDKTLARYEHATALAEKWGRRQRWLSLLLLAVLALNIGSLLWRWFS